MSCRLGKIKNWKQIKVEKALNESENLKVNGAQKLWYTEVDPTPVASPVLIAKSKAAMELLDWHPDIVQQTEFIQVVSGNRVLPESKPYSHCYCGHQFGYFSGQLGDGAAIYLGEVLNGHTQHKWELQLKGSGLTPYSRSADGRKVLRSSLREFLCSEHMHALGIPTTRAATIVSSSTVVMRDPLYDGHPIEEPACVVSRVAESFLRFGSFELFKATDPMTGRKGPYSNLTPLEKKEKLKSLLELVIGKHFSFLSTDTESTKFRAFFVEVVKRTAILVAKWQAVGFCHGVLNTDNMSIIGATIDYGPFAFMEHFDPYFVCNGSDQDGRYAYCRQPEICKWNLQVLADQLEDVIGPLKSEVEAFDVIYETHLRCHMLKKLGMNREQSESNCKSIIENWWKTMEETGADFTMAFRSLHKLNLDGSNLSEMAAILTSTSSGRKQYEQMFASKIPSVVFMQIKSLMTENEVDKVLQFVSSKLGISVTRLAMELERFDKRQEYSNLTDENIEKKNQDAWDAWLKQYSQYLQVAYKNATEEDIQTRIQSMKDANPCVILRNSVAQRAIECAETSDHEGLQKIVDIVLSPYNRPEDSFFTRPQAEKIVVTCSS